MSKKIIFSEAAPKPVGPYNQAVSAGGFVFLAGQIPLDPSSGKMVDGDVVAQTERVFENIKAVLAKAGLTLENVVKTTVFMQDLAEFAQMNGVYSRYFEEQTAPARSTVQVAGLPLGAKVEIEVVAVEDR
ncbi:MAG: RidA family protein [Candidatus Omnitrophica bacterium]|nr:RidA family protein [Candidatus Omnitrophota bacterium]